MTDVELFDKVYLLVNKYADEYGIKNFISLKSVPFSHKKDMINSAKTYAKRNLDYLKYAKDNNVSYSQDYITTYTVYKPDNQSENLKIMVGQNRDFKFFLIYEAIKYNYINDKDFILKSLASYEKQNKENFEKKTDLATKIEKKFKNYSNQSLIDRANSRRNQNNDDEIYELNRRRIESNGSFDFGLDYDPEENDYLYFIITLKPKFKVGDEIEYINLKNEYVDAVIESVKIEKYDVKYSAKSVNGGSVWLYEKSGEKDFRIKQNKNTSFIMAKAKAKLKLLAIKF